MYKEGVIYPTDLFFIYDQSEIYSIEDVKKLISASFTKDFKTEEEIIKALILEINSINGYVIIPLLFNYFPNIIFRIRKGNKELEINSNFIIDQTGFNQCVFNNVISLDELDLALEQLKLVAKFDKSKLINELYLFLYKCFFIKVFKYVNYSSSEDNLLFIDYEKDMELYFETQKELNKNKPFEIAKYSAKFNFCKSFVESFNETNHNNLLNKMSSILSHTKQDILKTFKSIIENNVVFNENQTKTYINKNFKPLYKVIESYLLEKKYDNTPSSKKTLTKANSKFMLQ